MMFGKKERRESKRNEERRQAHRSLEAKGAALTRRLYEIRKLDTVDRPRAVQDLFKDAHHQLELIRQSIADRSRYDFSGGHYEDPEHGDLATVLAEDIASIVRENTVNPPSIWQALSEQVPAVHFKIDRYDATSIVAAMMREMHLAGVIEGLELAGALPDSTK